MNTMYCNEKLVINISGAIFETFDKTLRRFPNTLLGNEQNRRAYFCNKSKQYFFNRSRHSFEAILFFYQSKGNLARPPSVQLKQFEEDCVFFQLPEEDVKSMRGKEGHTCAEEIIDPSWFVNTGQWLSEIQRKLWLIMESPSTSRPARCFSFFSISMILISLAATCLETIPQLKANTDFLVNDPWFIIELLVSSWFLLELLARFFCAPKKMQFFHVSLNWVDIVAVIPYFIVFAVDHRKVRSFQFLRVLRLWRVLRLFRISNHSKRMRAVSLIMKEGFKDFQFFLVCLTIIVVFGSTVMYFIEGASVDTAYTSIPESMWWTIQTLLTVGYGDITPMSIQGKLFSCGLMVIGAVIMSLPALAIIINFSSHLAHIRKEEEDEKAEKEKIQNEKAKLNLSSNGSNKP